MFFFSYQASSSIGAPVVIDNGSGRTKAGLATSELPSVVFPAIIGKPNYEVWKTLSNLKQLNLVLYIV